MNHVENIDSDALIVHLHDHEFDVHEDMIWPWVFWRDFAKDGHAYIAAIDRTKITDNPGNFDIAQTALDLRLNGPVEQGLDKLRIFLDDNAFGLDTLSLNMRLELLFLCFSEKKWKLLDMAALNLLSALQAKSFSNHHRKKCDLIFEALCFSFFRQHADGFINNSKDTLKAFNKLLSDSGADTLLPPESAARIFFNAQAKFSAGDIEGGMTGFEPLIGYQGFKSPVFPQTHCLLGDLDALARNEGAIDAAYRDFSNATHHFDPTSEGAHAFLVSTDQIYLDRFGELYCAISAKTQPGSILHFHCVNLHDEATAKQNFDLWQARHGVIINWSQERNRMLDTPPKVPSFTEAIASCARYVYLPDYLDHYESVTVTDIDGWPEAPMDMLTDFTASDIRVNSWIWRAGDGAWRTPWSNISAGLFSASSNRASKRTMQLVSLYLKAVFTRNYEHGKYCFYADQAALFLCLKYAEKAFGTRISFIEGSFKQSAQQHHLLRDDQKQKTMLDKLAALEA